MAGVRYWSAWSPCGSQDISLAIKSLKQGIEKLSDGEYEHRIVVNRTDELGMIAEEFNVLAEGIARRNDQLASQQRSLLHREQLATVGKMSSLNHP